MNYKDTRMEFQEKYGKRVTLRGMPTGAIRICLTNAWRPFLEMGTWLAQHSA
jgi:hypothetical protein